MGAFKNLRDPTKTRQDYIKQLVRDVSTYFGYTPYLVETLLDHLSPSECMELFHANEKASLTLTLTLTLTLICGM